MHLNKKIFFLLGSLFIFLGITQWRTQKKLIVPSFLELEKNEAMSNIFTLRMGMDRKDEIGELSDRFDAMVARYGGKEFVVILPSTPAKEGFQLAETIRKTVEALKISHQEGPFGQITISLGGTSAVPTPETNYSIFLETADAALYKAKTNGRNQIIFHRHLCV